MSKPIEVSNIGRRQLGKVLTCSILLFCLNRQAYSHEVETNRMSLVQRDQAHVIATFYITTTDFFQPVLENPNSAQMVLVQLASMDDAFFESIYLKALSFYRNAITFNSGTEQSVQLSNWRFIPWQSVKQSIQTRLAHQLVSPESHAHAEPIQFSVHLTSKYGLPAVRPNLPTQWGRVLAVASKPRQSWIDTSRSPEWIAF